MQLKYKINNIDM